MRPQKLSLKKYVILIAVVSTIICSLFATLNWVELTDYISSLQDIISISKTEIYDLSHSNRSYKAILPNIINSKSIGCDWYAPFDRMKSHSNLNGWFNNIAFDHNKTLEYIYSKSKTNCYKTEKEYVFTFNQNHTSQVNIAIATVIILHSAEYLRNHTDANKNIFSDIRAYHLKIANTLRYCEINGYSFILLFEPIFKYKYNGIGNKTLYESYMKSATFQKPFLVSKYLSNYDWILFLDYDTMIMNCNLNIKETIIDYAYYLNKRHTNSSFISIIAGGEAYRTINAGVWLIRNNEWAHKLLTDWMFVTENAATFHLLNIHSVMADQTIFLALLQGFNVSEQIKNPRNYWEMDKKRGLFVPKNIPQNMKEYRKILPIVDENLGRYIVVINETIINSKIYYFKNVETQPTTLILHYYAGGKTKQSRVFPTFRYALDHCS